MRGARRSIAVALAIGATRAATGCAHAPATSAQVPEYAPHDQTRALAAKTSSHPLILEWPAADRAALESQRARGAVVVRYGQREIEVLRGCRATGSYRYVPLTPKHEGLVIRDKDELDATMPIHAARLEAKLESKQSLEVAMTIVGVFEIDAKTWRAADLQGDCAGATHVIQALTVGAFEIVASARAGSTVGVKALGMGAEAHHEGEREVLRRDGSAQGCAKSAASDASPPYECGALLRVDVSPIQFPLAAGATAPPSPIAPRSGACPQGLVRRASGDTCEAVNPEREPLLDVLGGGKR